MHANWGHEPRLLHLPMNLPSAGALSAGSWVQCGHGCGEVSPACAAEAAAARRRPGSTLLARVETTLSPARRRRGLLRRAEVHGKGEPVWPRSSWAKECE